MGNTPLINEEVVPKKNALFEVTTVSKALAAVLFIILPFIGFWIGMQFRTQTPMVDTIPTPTLEKISEVNALPEKAEVNLKTNDTISTSTQTRDYRGAWFKISYPTNFTPNFSDAEASKSDEVYFISPDSSVEFFVYSPLWYGNPSTYLDTQPNEEKISDESKTVSVQINPSLSDTTITRWVTYRAKDKSYTRSVVSIKGQAFDAPGDQGRDAVFHHVFGIKYKDQASYDLYLPQYLAFKKSLTQYAD